MNWTSGVAGTKNTPALDSECGNYRVADCRSIRKKKPFRLISFIHESDDGSPMFWDFTSEQEAKDYAEMI
mgnify:CR=1 FL=1